MARRLRNDACGAIFHVLNRGRNRRPIFLDVEDHRFFLSRIVYAVRRGEIEVLGYSLMTNHFHLLVRSCGGLSEALRRIENEYSKYFNTKYGDEGELCKGRFLSVCVRDDYHLRNAVLYLDENPLSPTPPLATRAEAYEWGSAYRFARARRTLWLSRDAVEAAGVTYGGAPAVPVSPRVRRARRSFIHARLRGGDEGVECLPELLSGDPERVLGWLRRQSRTSPGGGVSLPAAGREIVLAELGELAPELSERVVTLKGRRAHRTKRLLTVGLLRDLSRLNFARIAETTESSDTTAKRRYRFHASALDEDPAYAELACQLVVRCVAPLKL